MMANTIDTERIELALADPKAPWYESDLVDWVSALVKDYKIMGTEIIKFNNKYVAIKQRLEAENRALHKDILKQNEIIADLQIQENPR